jgi:hypothetical protein
MVNTGVANLKIVAKLSIPSKIAEISQILRNPQSITLLSGRTHLMSPTGTCQIEFTKKMITPIITSFLQSQMKTIRAMR